MSKKNNLNDVITIVIIVLLALMLMSCLQSLKQPSTEPCTVDNATNSTQNQTFSAEASHNVMLTFDEGLCVKTATQPSPEEVKI